MGPAKMKVCVASLHQSCRIARLASRRVTSRRVASARHTALRRVCRLVKAVLEMALPALSFPWRWQGQGEAPRPEAEGRTGQSVIAHN